MFQKRYSRSVSTRAAFLAMLAATVPVLASDIVFPGGGTLSQVVDGGGTYSVITLLNLDTVSVPYTLSFYADNGQPLALTTSNGSGAILTGIISVGGSVVIKTSGTGSTILQGYAVLSSQSPNCFGFGPGSNLCQVGGSVVFGLPLTGQVDEASVPLDTGLDHLFAIPFDQTNSNVGVAIANSVGDALYQPAHVGELASLKFSFYDQTGNNFLNSQMQLGAGQHTALVLSTQFPGIAGKTGVMVVQSTNASGQPYYIKGLGLRVNLAGTTYTSITPVIPCNFSQTTGCTD